MVAADLSKLASPYLCWHWLCCHPLQVRLAQGKLPWTEFEQKRLRWQDEKKVSLGGFYQG